jgi:hypothetical protein
MAWSRRQHQSLYFLYAQLVSYGADGNAPFLVYGKFADLWKDLGGLVWVWVSHCSFPIGLSVSSSWVAIFNSCQRQVMQKRESFLLAD